MISIIGGRRLHLNLLVVLVLANCQKRAVKGTFCRIGRGALTSGINAKERLIVTRRSGCI